MARPSSIAQEPAEDAEEALRKEVASFISAEVGLGSHSTPDGTFDDFAPENAAKKLGEVGDAPKRKKKSTNKFKSVNDHDGSADAAEVQAKEPDASITERTWNEGAGQRPGGKGKDLVDRDESSVWYEAAEILPKLTDSNAAAPAHVLETKTTVAQKLIETEADSYQKKLSRTNPADASWLQTVRRSGTTRDQIAASALLVQQSALHNIRALDELITLSCKRGGAQAAAGHAVDALRELFTEYLLPDRRLVGFDARPVHRVKPSKAGDKQLLYWWVEDCIKRRYSTFVQALEDLSMGNLDWAKQKALKAAHELLAAKPEQEARLLTIMVNKLGDPSRRMASNAGYLISCLLTTHPMMSTVVVREIESFLFRPNQKARAVYYAVITLNQMVLSHHNKHGTPVATKLIDIYFTLFSLVLDRKIGNAAQQQQQLHGTEDPNKSPGSVAEGASERATRETSGRHGDDDEGGDRDGDEDFDEDDMHDAHAHGVSKFKDKASSRKASFLAKGKGKGARGKGGKGKHHAKGKKSKGGKESGPSGGGLSAEVADARMLSALIAGVRRAYPYVESKELEDVFSKHADQLFRTVHVAPLTVSVQALMLLFQVMSSQSAVNDRFHAALYSLLLRPSLENSSTLPMLFGLLYQALSADVSSRRVAAFIKRMLQFAAGASANVACGALVVVSEVLKAKAVLWNAVLEPEDRGLEDLQDAADATTDADVSEKEASEEESSEAAHVSRRALQKSKARQGKSVAVLGAVGAFNSDHKWPGEDYYDINKRAPQFARADRACWWELCGLRAHVHPSVAAMAGALLAGTSVVYDGDPIGDLTVLAFLDKFVKRKPKRGDKGKSAMQPVAAEASQDPMATFDAPGSGAAEDTSRGVAQPGSIAFAALAAQDVKAEDVFFHRYFTLERVKKRRAQVARTRSLTKKKKKSGEEGSDDEEGSDGGASEEEEDSAAEEDFLEGLETMQDDALGDPEVGGLNEDLMVEMAAQMNVVDGEEDSLDEASIEASIEDEDDSFMDDIEDDADSPAGGLTGTLQESDVEVEHVRNVEGDHEGSGNDAFDEDAFAKALFGSSGGDPDASDESENELGAGLIFAEGADGSDKDEGDASVKQKALVDEAVVSKKGVKTSKTTGEIKEGAKRKGEKTAAGKQSGAFEDKQKKKKRRQSGDLMVGYEQYAHLLDQYDEVNKQPLPAEEAQGMGKHSKKRRKNSKGSG